MALSEITERQLNSALASDSAASEIKTLLEAALQGTSNLAVRFGQHTTAAASDTVSTGLSTVAGAIAVLDDDPVDGVMQVTASIGNQSGAPAAGSILIKSWKSTDADATQVAGTTFSKKVNWIAWGTA